MSKLITLVSKWLAKKLALLLAILFVLLIAVWVKSEWQRIKETERGLQEKERVIANLQADRERLENEAAQLSLEWEKKKDATIKHLNEDLSSINEKMQRANAEWSTLISEYSDLEKTATKARSAANEARITRDKLQKDVDWWPRGTKWAFAPVKELETAKATFFGLDKTAKLAEAVRDRFAPRVENSPLTDLQEEKHRTEQQIAQAEKGVSPGETAIRKELATKQADIDSLSGSIAADRERIQRDPVQRILSSAKAQIPLALWILAGIIATPVLLKALFYYVLAPIASKLPPIRILPNKSAPAIPSPQPSSVSVSIDVAPKEEIVVHSDFLQSCDVKAKKHTQLFLNSRLPFSSIASGMFLLTRIHCDGTCPTRVVVSSQNDAFGELGVIELPEEAAMVVHPRSLAGVVKVRSHPVSITRHWRLFSLHAWLTLQLRYLVIHGPCKLVLKGCRGVKAEAPDEDAPRMINQAATIGFSANLEYKNTRCETFVSYLRGKENLFNDQFAGSSGRYLYEELPDDGRRGGITGRGLEGVVDALLKPLGI